MNPAGYRKLVGLTQSQLAKKYGVSTQSVSDKERGKTPYTDDEKYILRDLVRDAGMPDITIDQIFFSSYVLKSTI